MHTYASPHALDAALAAARREGRSIGLVPTMGALHQGHVSLIGRARADNDVVVVSVFVNPLQFGPGEDLAAYPRDLNRDAAVASRAGADHLFAPSVAAMYPGGALSTRVEVGPIGDAGEGRWRPGFFSGVATVCCKLFNIVRPHRAYFGQKDAQQLAVIRSVVADLNLPPAIIGCPTLREPDGLAASSRNAFLDAEQRRAAPALAAALFAARDAVAGGESRAPVLQGLIQAHLAHEPLVRLQYAEVFDTATFAPLATVEGRAVLAAAAFVGPTRLIDNVEVGPPPQGALAPEAGIMVAR